MLEKLSREQQIDMLRYKDEYLRFITRGKESEAQGFDKLREDIHWVYQKAGLNPPKFILTAGSYLEEKMMINHVMEKGITLEGVEDEIHGIDLGASLEGKISGDAYKDASSRLWAPIYEQVTMAIKDAIERQTRLHTADNEQVNKDIDKDFVAPHMWHALWNEAKKKTSKELYAQTWSEMTRAMNPPINRVVVDQVTLQLNEGLQRNDIGFKIWKQVMSQTELDAKSVDYDGTDISGLINASYRKLMDNLGEQVGKQIHEGFESGMHAQVRNAGEANISNQVFHMVKLAVASAIRDEIANGVGFPVGRQTESQVKNRVKSQWIEQGFGLPWNSWFSFYAFFEKLGAIDNEDFKRYYYSFLRGNKIWSVQFFRTWCIVTRLPHMIHRDSENRLHSVDTSAVEWEKGEDNINFFIHGISFGANEQDRNMWEHIVRGTGTAAEIMKIGNMEQRNAALSVIPQKRLIDELDAELMSTFTQKKKGKEYMPREAWEQLEHKPIKLYRIDHNKIEGIGRNDIYILFYTDPSTKREYFSYADPQRVKDAADAMAAKFGMTRDEYLELLAVES